ncbi:MAG: hypothetical protein BBJ57_09060 [Desulfobacterales bacterium PC51MH44]|nr:MAG: hypothetical protein BBJ57_09060 [Desulfobacterales bacterium PC51MH44]
MEAHSSKKYSGSVTLAFIIFFAFLMPLTTPIICFSQSIDLTIGDYALVSKQRVGRTAYDYIFTANITNNGTEDAVNVTATLTSLVPTTTVIDGSLTFGAVPAGATVTSSDTLTVRIDRLYPFNESDLSWDIHYDVGEAGARLEVGPEGGMLRFDRFEVTVPPDVLAEPVEISVTELPSQAEEVAKDLDPARAQPIGPAFQFEAPFFSNEPLTLSLSYDENDIPPGFEAQNLAILIRLKGYPEFFGSMSMRESPIVMFVPLPAQVDEQNRKVQVHIFAGGTFQIVALAEPLEVFEVASLDTKPQHLFKRAFARLMMLLNPFSVKEAIAQPQVPLNPFRVIFWEVPANWTLTDRDKFKADILAGLNSAYQKLVLEKGFPAPLAQVTVHVRKIPGLHMAEVSSWSPLYIVIDPFKEPIKPIQSLMAHEYFHVIQMWNSNYIFVSDQVYFDNEWFEEGTADWAMDEVFDNVSGHYNAPTGERFHAPLNTNDPSYTEETYETVAFWKWLETKAPGSIRAMIEHHRSLTHSSISSLGLIKNMKEARYLDSLTYLHPDLNFLMFVTDALYWKNFEKDESDLLDLWGLLGDPKDVPEDLHAPEYIFTLEKCGPGDGEANKLKIPYTVYSHLAADVFIIDTWEGEEALSGTLHVEFEKPDGPTAQEFVAAVILRDTHKQKLVKKLSTTREVTFGFGPGSEVVVIIVDPQWKAPFQPDPFGYGDVNVWVEPCGGETPPGAFTWNVSSEQELYNAVDNACCGDTILLAPGRYWLPGRSDYPQIYSLNIEKGVTIAGSGPLETTIVLSGNLSGIFIGTWPGVIEQATFRDLRIDDRSDFGLWVWGNVRRFSLCNVIVVSSQRQRQHHGLMFSPFSIAEKLELHGTDFVCQDCQPYCKAIMIDPVDWPGRFNVEVEMRDSSIWNWDIGVSIYSTDFGDVTLDIDCTKIFGNQWNVVEWFDCDPRCTAREHCPSGQ